MTLRELRPQAHDQGGVQELLAGRYPRTERPTMRVNFVSSVDGAVTIDGVSGGLGGPSDKILLSLLRRTCDALIVASGTVRKENYDGLRLDGPSRAWRREHGLPEYPLMVIVSGSLELNLEQKIFSDAPIRPVVITHEAAPAGKRAAVAEVADLITVGATEVDLPAAVAALHARGATQLLCEGGPSLFGALIAADLVDELCLTVSPLLTGGEAGRISAGPSGPPRGMTLKHVLSDDGMLFLRYARDRD